MIKDKLRYLTIAKVDYEIVMFYVMYVHTCVYVYTYVYVFVRNKWWGIHMFFLT